MPYVDKSIPDLSRPRLPTTTSGVAWQGTCENYATAGLSKNERERRKANEEAAGNVKRKKHTHECWYLKYWNNDWKEKRAGRHDGAKDCRYTVPTGNKVERK